MTKFIQKFVEKGILFDDSRISDLVQKVQDLDKDILNHAEFSELITPYIAEIENLLVNDLVI